MVLPEVGPTVAPEDRFAAAVFEAAIEVARDRNVEPAALAGPLEAALRRVYGVETSSPLPLLLRMLQVWKPSTRVHAEAGALRLVSTGCPLLAVASRDGVTCRVCVGLQRELLRLSLGVPPAAIEVPHTVAGGDARCEVRVHLLRREQVLTEKNRREGEAHRRTTHTLR